VPLGGFRSALGDVGRPCRSVKVFPGGMRIGEFAGLVGISTRAIRHYHHVGLLPEPARRANGYREYSLRDAVELARVRRLTELGLSPDEVGDALARDAGRDLAEILRELDAGRAIDYVSHEFYRVADGLLAEEWICSDMTTLLRQLS